MDFAGKGVIVTGASGALGRAVVAAFAAAGARLLLLDRSAAKLAGAFGAESADRLLRALDLRDAAAVEAAVADGMTQFGSLDVLVNVAGGFDMGPAVHETDADLWDRMLEINAGTLLTMVRAVVPRMLDQGAGKIVNIGAMGALGGKAHMGAYIASKSAVMRLTESMAAELRSRGINVNCVLPSIIDTPANRAAMPKSDPATWVAPEALADVILFLASERARAVHGACLPVVGLS